MMGGKARLLVLVLALITTGLVATSCNAFYYDAYLAQVDDFTPMIGVEFGTDYVQVGVCKEDHVEILANEHGSRRTPAWVAFTGNGTLVGEAARLQADDNPERTIFGIKKLLGRKFEDEEVQRLMKSVPYKIIDKHGRPYIEVKVNNETRVFSPVEITSMILSRMKEIAQAHLGREPKSAVTGVSSALHNHEFRQAIDEAFELAGFLKLTVLPEAALAIWASSLHHKEGKNLLVCNLGAGGFDATIFLVEDGYMESLKTAGNTRLGGWDFDERLLEYITNFIKEKSGRDINRDEATMARLRRQAERAKCELSQQERVDVELDFDEHKLTVPVTRAQFEELTSDMVEMMMELVKEVVDGAELNKSDVDEVVVFGNGARNPKVKQLLREMFEKKDVYIAPDEAVVYGATLWALLQQQDSF